MMYGPKDGGMVMSFLMFFCLIAMAVIFFIFSVIFWLVHNWLVKK
jgi:hypothetical protein